MHIYGSAFLDKENARRRVCNRGFDLDGQNDEDETLGLPIAYM